MRRAIVDIINRRGAEKIKKPLSLWRGVGGEAI
jgi:hypothetical protein